MMRFSLAMLLLTVLFAAIGSAALVNANDLWRQTMVTATVTALVVAALSAVIWQGRSRVFALGFAVTGWIYLALVFVSALGLRNDLLTDRAVTWLFETIHGEQAQQQRVIQNVAFSPDGTRIVTSSNDATVRLWNVSTGQAVSANASGRNVELNDFADIGHSLWVIIVGFLGGVVAGILARSKRQDEGES